MGEEKEKKEDFLKSLLDLITSYGEIELQDVTLNAEDFEITVKTGAPASAASVRREIGMAFAELGRLLAGVAPSVTVPAPPPPTPTTPPPPPKPKELPKVEFKPPTRKYPGKIAEVTIG
ncbi:MAG: hypothetical protein DRO36_04065, partial [Candidatus Hecatellales archaeon]